MTKVFYSLLLAGAVLLCGCDKQTRLNTEQITALSQKLVAIQQIQSQQLATIQSELTSLAPMLERTNSVLFEKSHDDAFFYHTNTLFLLLLVDNKIESELQVAAAEREADKALAYAYHTNETDLLRLGISQIQDALAGQENRLMTNLIAETSRTVADQNEAVLEQMKALAPDADETARRTRFVADVAQLKLDVAQIKAHFGLTNSPNVGP